MYLHRYATASADTVFPAALLTPGRHQVSMSQSQVVVSGRTRREPQHVSDKEFTNDQTAGNCDSGGSRRHGQLDTHDTDGSKRAAEGGAQRNGQGRSEEAVQRIHGPGPERFSPGRPDRG